MPDWLLEAISSTASIPVVQAAIIAIGTFILEDPTTIGSGLLVADGVIGYPTALFGLWFGIAIGDLGLYLIGRFFGDKVVKWNWISRQKLEKGREWFSRNIVTAVLVSRFIPGLRLPTYVGAGVAGASAVRFLLTAVAATLIWTVLLLALTIELGETVLPMLGNARWIVLGVLLVVIILVNVLIHRKAKKKGEQMEEEPPVASSFEFMHPVLFYIPVGFYYLWLSIRYFGPTLPTASNPSIYSGGMVGESKSQILNLLPGEQREWIASFTTYTPGEKTSVEKRLAEALTSMQSAGLSLPVVAKPDQGHRGDGVRPIRSEEDLRAYLSDFPPEKKLVLQTLVPHEGEAGVMYYRHPEQKRGSIFSLTFKEFPRVIGDGRRTLRELILADRRAPRMKKLLFRRHREKLDTVLEEGKVFTLVFSGNHCQGTIFKNGVGEITEALLDRFDELARSMPEFYFGRFDVRFEDKESFLKGESFKIIEVNGAGAEAIHIWDSSMKIGEAYRTLFKQYKILFEIGACNRKRGHKPLGAIRFLRDFFSYCRQAARYPATQ